MPTLNSHTHCQVAPADTQAKTWQRVCLYLTQGKKDKAAKMNRNIDGKITNETLTRGIKHWGLIGYLIVLPRIKFGVTRQESSPQSPTISYRHPLGVMLQNHRKRMEFIEIEI